MARPRVRDRLLAAAQQLYREGGGAPTTQAIAQRAGVTEASLFNNFGDKAGLLQALLYEATPEYTTLIDCIERQDNDPVQWLAGVFDAACDYFRVILPLTAPQLSAPPAPIAESDAASFFRPYQRLRSRLIRLVADGRLSRPADPGTAALMVMGAAMHTALTTLTLGTAAPSLDSHVGITLADTLFR